MHQGTSKKGACWFPDRIVWGGFSVLFGEWKGPREGSWCCPTILTAVVSKPCLHVMVSRYLLNLVSWQGFLSGFVKTNLCRSFIISGFSYKQWLASWEWSMLGILQALLIALYFLPVLVTYFQDVGSRQFISVLGFSLYIPDLTDRVEPGKMGPLLLSLCCSYMRLRGSLWVAK